MLHASSTSASKIVCSKGISMGFRDVIIFKWVAFLWFLDKAGVTPKGLIVTGVVVGAFALGFVIG